MACVKSWASADPRTSIRPCTAMVAIDEQQHELEAVEHGRGLPQRLHRLGGARTPPCRGRCRPAHRGHRPHPRPSRVLLGASGGRRPSSRRILVRCLRCRHLGEASVVGMNAPRAEAARHRECAPAQHRLHAERRPCGPRDRHLRLGRQPHAAHRRHRGGRGASRQPLRHQLAVRAEPGLDPHRHLQPRQRRDDARHTDRLRTADLRHRAARRGLPHRLRRQVAHGAGVDGGRRP